MKATTPAAQQTRQVSHPGREGRSRSHADQSAAGTPADRLLDGTPPELRLRRRREKDRTSLGQGWLSTVPSSLASCDGDPWLRVGDTELHRALLNRADLVCQVRRDGPHANDPMVLRMRAVIDRPMTIGEAVEESGDGRDGSSGFYAVVHLIDVGALRTVGGYAVHYRATVEPVRGDGDVER